MNGNENSVPWQMHKNLQKFNFKWLLFLVYLAHFLRNCSGMDVSNIQSTSVQVMAWCWQAMNHYLRHCWPMSSLPYVVIRGWLDQKENLYSLCIIFLANQFRYENNIHSNAVITQSNIVRYCIKVCWNWGTISIKCWIHKRHPIPRPLGRDMGCLLWIFLRKLTAL